MNAAELLVRTWGPGEPAAVGWAPGRCTIIGEHVDYAGGVMLATATDLGVEVALRRGTSRHRIVSGDRRVEREDFAPQGDIGDRILAAAGIAGGTGGGHIDVAVVADLPESAGLSSSAAISVATLVAMLRLRGARMTRTDLIAAALTAERDIVGVPCGILDQTTVVESDRDAALLIDAARGSVQSIPWPWPDVVMVVCNTGVAHDVGGEGYRRRRVAADAILAMTGADTARDITMADIATLPGDLQPYARHLMSECHRVDAAVAALHSADAAGLGALMSAGHASLRDDYRVSTPALDATVRAAEGVEGVLGARLVGAGFGGSAIALAHTVAAAECARSMAAAAGTDAASATWIVHPAPGVASRSPDVIVAD